MPKKFETEIQHEVSLYVADYRGFEECKADISAATQECMTELDQLFDAHEDAYNIIKVEYQDTDSTNPDEASIYFLCTIEVSVQALFDTAWTLRCDLEAKGMD